MWTVILILNLRPITLNLTLMRTLGHFFPILLVGNLSHAHPHEHADPKMPCLQYGLHQIHLAACLCASLCWDKVERKTACASNFIRLTFITFVLNKLKKSLFSWNYSEKNIIQSSVLDCLAKIIQITMIVWGSQTFSRWSAAGKYRWRRQLRDNIPFYIIYFKPH